MSEQRLNCILHITSCTLRDNWLLWYGKLPRILLLLMLNAKTILVATCTWNHCFLSVLFIFMPCWHIILSSSWKCRLCAVSLPLLYFNLLVSYILIYLSPLPYLLLSASVENNTMKVSYMYQWHLFQFCMDFNRCYEIWRKNYLC